MTCRRTKFKHDVDRLQKKDRSKSSIRAKAEHVFRILKRAFGFDKVRYRGLRKNRHRLCATFVRVNLVPPPQTPGRARSLVCLVCPGAGKAVSGPHRRPIFSPKSLTQAQNNLIVGKLQPYAEVPQTSPMPYTLFP